MIWNEDRFRFVTQSQAGPVGRFLHRSGVKIQAYARQLITVEKLVRDGHFRNSIAYEVDNSGPTLRLKVGSNVPHFRYLELGTDPHPIYPREKEALWWEQKPHGDELGWIVPTRPLARVNHPGNPAYRIVGRSIDFVLGGRSTPFVRG